MNLYTLSNLFLLFTGFVGLMVILIILRSYKSNKIANIYLVILLAFISVRFIIIGVVQFNLSPQHFKQPLIFKLFSLTIIPCFFLYFESLLAEKKKFNVKNLYHFILPFLFIIWNLTVNYFYFEPPSWVVIINFIYVFITVIFYLLSMYLLLQRKLWSLKLLSKVANFHLLKSWTIFLFTVVLLLGIRILISLTNELIYDKTISASGFALFIAPILWLMVLLKLLISPEILHGVHYLKKRIQINDKELEKLPSTWRLNNVTIKNEQDLKLKDKIDGKSERLARDVDSFVADNKSFTNSVFTINELAIKLGIPKSHLVYLFKYHSNLTFSEYKTYQRIRTAMDLIHNGHLSTNTLESLATEVGFLSYNPFFTAFKKHTGLSPNDYVLKNMK